MRVKAIVRCTAILLLTLAPRASLAVDPCAEVGAGCRPLTAAEIKGLQGRFLALSALLPAPDPSRYVHDGAVEASTMPFVAETKIPGAALTCSSWPAGCFTTQDGVGFGYDAKAAAATAGRKPRSIFEAAENMLEAGNLKVEVAAWLRPHPHRVDAEGGRCVDVGEPDAVRVEKSATFLSWETDVEGSATLHLIFGPRSCKEAETEQVERPAKALAPVVSIEVQASGPSTEVAAIKKKIDRRAFEALLGPVVK